MPERSVKSLQTAVTPRLIGVLFNICTGMSDQFDTDLIVLDVVVVQKIRRNQMSDNQHFFKCHVSEELAGGKLRVGRREYNILVDEKSIDGFTIRINAADLAKVNPDSRKEWVLQHQGEFASVEPESLLKQGADYVQMSLHRLRDLTPPPRGDSSLASLISMRGIGRRIANYPELMLGGSSILLLILLTIPGFGDHLGTAPRIRQGAQTLIKETHSIIRSAFR